MAGFEIGSIFASLKLENKDAIDSLKETAKATVDFGKKVGKNAAEVGKKFQEGVKVDPKKAKENFDGLTKAVTDFGTKTAREAGRIGKLITRRVSADPKEFKAKLDGLSQAVTQFGVEAKAKAKAAGDQVQKSLTVDPSKARIALEALKKKIKDFRRAIGKDSQVDLINSKGFLSRLHKLNLALRRQVRKWNKELKVRLGIDPKKTINSFTLIGAAGRKSASAIKKAFAGVQGIFQRLRKSVFGIQGILLQIGIGLSGIGLINRAKEVEQLRAGFDNLTRSIGGTSASFLGKLRQATRGAVSDLELMRTANNAILLGVAKNEDAFAELATVARRLGQAVGRNATDAINDLSIGIGRQSRLILDNLGLIVKVEEANEAYALTLGRTVGQLTDAERRQAFFNAAMEAGRKKIAELGDDVPTLAQAWGRFTAAISNTVTAIAEAFVGPGGFNVIADWLEENQQRIAVFARFIARTVTGLFKIVGTLLASFFEGGTLGDFTDRLTKFIADAIEFVGKLIFGGLGALFGKLGFFLLKLLALLFSQLAFAIGEKVANLFNTLTTKALKLATEVFSKIPGLAELLGLDDPDVVQSVLDQIEKDGAATAERIKKNAKDSALAIKAEINKTIGDIGDELKVLAKEAREGIATSAEGGNTYAAVWTKAIDHVTGELNRLGLELADVNATATDLRVALPLQGLANQLNELNNIQRTGIQVAAKYGDELLSPEDVKKRSEAIAELREKIVEVNDLFGKLKAAPEGARATIQKEFTEAFNETQAAIFAASQDAFQFSTTLQSGLSRVGGTSSEVDRVTDAFVKLNEQFQKITRLGEVVDLALAPTFIGSEDLAKLLEPLKEQLKKLELEVQLVGLEETEKQLKQLEIAFETIRSNQLSPEQTARVNELEENLRGTILRIQELQNADKAAKAIKALDEEITSLNRKLQAAGADPLAVSLGELDAKLAKIIEETGATGEELQGLEERFRSLRGITTALRLDELSTSLEEARGRLQAVGQTEAEQKIAAIDAEFRRLSEALEGQPEKLAEVKKILDNLKRTEVEIGFRTELKTLRREVESARLELELIGSGPATRAVRELDTAFEELKRELGLNEEQAAELRRELEVLKGLKVRIEVESNIEELQAQARALEFERQAAFVFDDTDRQKLQVDQDLDRLKGDLRKSGKLTLDLEARLDKEAANLKDEIEATAGAIEFAELTRSVTDSVFKGIADGFAKGEKPSKIWADITSEIFSNALEKTLNDLTTSVTAGLGKIFEGLGAEAGVAGGLGGLATNLIGIAGLVLQNLDDKSQTTIDDFESQVNSSEAIRGVVAGPSNVAISKVNEGMKEALRTTEVLLERIAMAVEGGSSGGGGSSAGMRNASYPLTGSSS